MIERARFIGQCASSGLAAISRAWQSVLGVVSLLLAIGIGVQDRVPRTGPRWLKIGLLALLCVGVLLEGAFQQISGRHQPPVTGPPIQMNANVIHYNVIDATNAHNVSPPPPPADGAPGDSATS